jgi:hypothetical protein
MVNLNAGERRILDPLLQVGFITEDEIDELTRGDYRVLKALVDRGSVSGETLMTTVKLELQLPSSGDEGIQQFIDRVYAKDERYEPALMP